MSDLSLVSFDDLVDEIKRRSDTCIVAYIKELDGSSEEACCRYFGSRFAVLGLASHVVDKISTELMDIHSDDDE